MLTVLWVVVALLSLMVVCLWVTVYQMLMQHGRVLFRLDDLEAGLIDRGKSLESFTPLNGTPESLRGQGRPAELAQAATAGGAGSEATPGLGTERPLDESRIERAGRRAGSRAPSFSLPDINGQTVSLDQYRGRRVLLVFSAPNCEPCDALTPELVRFHSEQNDDMALIMVGRGEPEANRRKVQEYGVKFPVVLQRRWELSREYGIFATPAAFLISADGVIEENVATGVNGIMALARLPRNGGRSDEHSIR